MDYRQLNEQDIQELENDITKYMNARVVFMWSAIGSFIGAAMFLFLAIYLRTVQYQFYEISITLMGLSIAAGITMFILRSALFNRRISRRKTLIRRARDYQKQQQELENKVSE